MRLKLCLATLAALLLTGHPSLSFAQQPAPAKVAPAHAAPAQAAPDPLAALRAQADAAAKQAETQVRDQDVRQAAASDPRYVQAFTDFQIWNLHHLQTTFSWHHVCSIIIFFVVIFLVMSGLWLSWMQFRHAHSIPVAGVPLPISSANPAPSASADPAAPPAPPEQKEMVTEFSASPAGIKVASSVIGVVILVISLCFFYLYLDKVYPITIAPAPWNSPAATAK